MALRLTADGATYELRCLRLDWVRIDQDYVADVDIVASEAHTTATIACSHSGWLEISPDGGSNYYAVPTDVMSGYDLGAFTAGQRKSYKLRLHIPPGTSVRTEVIELYLGIGT